MANCLNHLLIVENSSEELARYYQVASALYEVLRDVTKNKVDSEVIDCRLFLYTSLATCSLGELLHHYLVYFIFR